MATAITVRFRFAVGNGTESRNVALNGADVHTIETFIAQVNNNPEHQRGLVQPAHRIGLFRPSGRVLVPATPSSWSRPAALPAAEIISCLTFPWGVPTGARPRLFVLF